MSILSLISGILSRYWTEALIGLALITVGLFLRNHYIEQGRYKAEAEASQVINEVVVKAEARLDDELKSQKQYYEAQLLRAKNQVRIKTEIKEVIKYVEQEPIELPCVDADVIGLLNKAVRAANDKH